MPTARFAPTICILSGGPCTGKSATLEALRRLGYPVLPEAARMVSSSDPRFSGKSIADIDKKSFQDAIFALQKKTFAAIDAAPQSAVFSDRGFVDTLAYYKINGLAAAKTKVDYTKTHPADRVFFLDPLPSYVADTLRTETKGEQEDIHRAILGMYREFGYRVTRVPVLPIGKRAQFIVEALEKMPR